MQRPLMRIPYTGPLPPPQIIPRNANTRTGAITALTKFLTAPSTARLKIQSDCDPGSTVILSGAGISVASGLADYRGSNGTYRQNKSYRPIYYHEFLQSHEARKRYWARSFLGWQNLHTARPNSGHFAIKSLGELGIVRSVITQNVDSFHPIAHPHLPTLELHGFLRALVCTTCGTELPRQQFQESLARLNPLWAAFLAEAIASGALATENHAERREKGMRTNPDGDVDVPDAPYSTFRYPACPTCLVNPPPLADGSVAKVEVDAEGAWKDGSNAGILKPAVVMFGESIAGRVKADAERAIDTAGRLLVIGSSLATYSAWRLARRAGERGMPIGILNLGGVRGEEAFFEHVGPSQRGDEGVRVEMSTDIILPALVEELGRRDVHRPVRGEASGNVGIERGGSAGVFKDMMS